MDPINGMNLAVAAGVIAGGPGPGPEGLRLLTVFLGDPRRLTTVYVPEHVVPHVPEPGSHVLLRGVVWPQEDSVSGSLDLVVTRIDTRRPGRDRPGMSTVALGGRTIAVPHLTHLPDGRTLATFSVEMHMGERIGYLGYTVVEPDLKDVAQLPVASPLLALGRLDVGPLLDGKGHTVIGFNARLVELGDAEGAWRLVEAISAEAVAWEAEEAPS